MHKSRASLRMLLIAAVILIVGITTFFLITGKNGDKKPVKGVFVVKDTVAADSRNKV